MTEQFLYGTDVGTRLQQAGAPDDGLCFLAGKTGTTEGAYGWIRGNLRQTESVAAGSHPLLLRGDRGAV